MCISLVDGNGVFQLANALSAQREKTASQQREFLMYIPAARCVFHTNKRISVTARWSSCQKRRGETWKRKNPLETKKNKRWKRKKSYKLLLLFFSCVVFYFPLCDHFGNTLFIYYLQFFTFSLVPLVFFLYFSPSHFVRWLLFQAPDSVSRVECIKSQYEENRVYTQLYCISAEVKKKTTRNPSR